MKDLQQIANKVMDIALSKNVQADCILNKSSFLSLKAENQELSEHKVSSSINLGVRIIKDNKVGTSYSESTDTESLEHMVNAAIDFSKYTNEEPLENITLKRETPLNGTLSRIFKEDKTPLEDKINFCMLLESEVKAKDSSVKSTPYNGLSEVEHEKVYTNHLGTFCQQRSKSFSCYTSALIEKNNQQSLHYHVNVGRSFCELDLNSVVEESYLHAHQLLGAQPIKTGKYDIIFTPDNLSSLFECFNSLFSAKAAMLDVNPWQSKLGTKVASEKLTIYDEPIYEHAFEYIPFDDEGEKTKALTLVKNGIFNKFYHNSVTAKHFNLPNTARASRSPKSSLGVSGTNIVIKPQHDRETQVKENEYIEIITMQGLHSGSDLFSGDFSFGASGYLKKGDEILQPIAGITISGNFFELLNQIDLVGDQIHSNSESSFFTPLIRFKNLTIAGA